MKKKGLHCFEYKTITNINFLVFFEKLKWNITIAS